MGLYMFEPNSIFLTNRSSYHAGLNSIRLDYAEPALVLFITIRTDLVVTSISIDYAERSVGFS